MNPQVEIEKLNREMEVLKKKIETIENAQNLDMNTLMFESLLKEKGDFGADLQRNINVTGTPFLFTVPENPIGSLKLNYKGTNYRILLYSLS